jgi:hypothetical protein
VEFTDDQILLLHELDFDPARSRWDRTSTLLWWAALTLGCLAATVTLLHADLGGLRRYGG